MKLRKVVLGAAMVAGASTAMAAPAQASIPICAGTVNTVIICVDPTGQTLYEDCVVIVSPPCIPVAVPGPTIGCGGEIGQSLCAANHDDPGPPIN